MPYKAIIFDFFDVIHADPFKRWLESRGLQREGAMHEASVALDKGLITNEEFLRRISDVCGLPPKSVQEEFSRHHIFDPGVITLVKTLASAYQVGLLSNGPQQFVRSLLQKADIEDTFHHVVISSEVGMVKPDPEIFEHILHKMNTSAAAAIFIDDNPKNIAAAQALGIHGICYTGLTTLRSDLAKLGVKQA